MRNYIKSISLIATLMTASLVSYASSAPSPVGYWQTINKDTNTSSIIQVYNAKAQVNHTTINVINGKILGTFVYGKKRSSPAPRCKKCEGQLENPPIVGLPILTGFKQAGKNSWQSGSLLSPKTGSSNGTKITSRLPARKQVYRSSSI